MVSRQLAWYMRWRRRLDIPAWLVLKKWHRQNLRTTTTLKRRKSINVALAICNIHLVRPTIMFTVIQTLVVAPSCDAKISTIITYHNLNLHIFEMYSCFEYLICTTIPNVFSLELCLILSLLFWINSFAVQFCYHTGSVLEFFYFFWKINNISTSRIGYYPKKYSSLLCFSMTKLVIWPMFQNFIS